MRSGELDGPNRLLVMMSPQILCKQLKTKLNSVALVRTRTIPTERPPPVGEVSANFCGHRGVTWSAQRVLTAVNLCFLELEPLLFFIQVAPQLTSRGWVDPVPDPLLLRKSGSAGDRTRDLCICSQKLWPLDYRGGPVNVYRTPKAASWMCKQNIEVCYCE